MTNHVSKPNPVLACRSVQEWLGQFPENQSEYAELTLRLLRFATTDEVSSDLRDYICEEVDRSASAREKVLLEVIISNEDIEDYVNNTHTTSPARIGNPRTAQRSTNTPETRPTEFAISDLKQQILFYGNIFPSDIRTQFSGSEKYLDLVRRDVIKYASKLESNPIVATGAQLPIFSAGDRLHIILFVDNVGSGTQALSFLQRMLKSCLETTISRTDWRITIVAWTATEKGSTMIQERLQSYNAENPPENNNSRVQFKWLKKTKTFHDLQDAEQKNNLFQFFRLHPSKGITKGTKGLGYKEIASRTILMGSSSPNTIPDLLYKSPRNSGVEGRGSQNIRPPQYRPLFHEKQIPTDIRNVAPASLPAPTDSARESREYLHELLEELRKQRLTQAAKRSPATNKYDSTWPILLLAVAKYTRDASIREIDIPYYTFQDSENFLLDRGWIDKQFRATEKGEAIVRNFGRNNNLSEYAKATRFIGRTVDASSIVYYPQSMRGVR